MAPDLASTRAASNGAGTLPPATGARPATPTGEAGNDRTLQSFAKIVAVLMRDWGFRNLRLSDLEWLVLPPVLSGQWRLAHSKVKQPGTEPETKTGAEPAPDGGLLISVAVVLWASVSPEIDKRLSENVDKKLLLRPDEWTTGDILWLIAAAGDQRGVRKIIKELRETEFQGRPVKLRTHEPDGKAVIKTLAAQSAGNEPRKA
ncbi:MAG: cytolysin-activating lysine-acyltransferase [Rhodospirillaceae bacterium]|nr:cytolysin-activating lysine-acyltransferase [Rhodospirillaceae bacterium]